MFRWRSSGLSAVSFEAGLSLWFQHSAISSHYSQHFRVGVSGEAPGLASLRPKLQKRRGSGSFLKILSKCGARVVWGKGRARRRCDLRAA